MARAQGARALMALAFETTFGTPPASGFTRMPFASTSLGAEQPLLNSELLGYGRDPLAPIKDAVTADGDVVVPLDAEAFGAEANAGDFIVAEKDGFRAFAVAEAALVEDDFAVPDVKDVPAKHQRHRCHNDDGEDGSPPFDDLRGGETEYERNRRDHQPSDEQWSRPVARVMSERVS